MQAKNDNIAKLPRHPWHIRWFPCEYVSVSPKEGDEREFLFITQARTDDGSLRWISLLKLDRLEGHIIS
jgi:hypothetical protein